MRILVLGAGATGGFFGGHLAKAGADVTFLVRPQRAEHLAERGLIVESPLGNFTTPVKTVTSSAAAGDCDMILLSCKAYDLAAAIDAIRPAVGPATHIVPLLNGLKHLDDLDAAFGAERVLGGTCHISVTLSPDGVIRHLSPAYYAMTQGPRSESQRGFSKVLHRELSRAAFDARFSDNIVHVMWEKWVLLATMASMTCLMRANLGEIARTTYGAEVVEATLRECCGAAAASGYAPSADMVERTLHMLTDRSSVIAASMLRDLEAGRRTEADHIIGDLITRAAEAGIATPNLTAAYTALQAYQMRETGV